MEVKTSADLCISISRWKLLSEIWKQNPMGFYENYVIIQKTSKYQAQSDLRAYLHDRLLHHAEMLKLE